MWKIAAAAIASLSKGPTNFRAYACAVVALSVVALGAFHFIAEATEVRGLTIAGVFGMLGLLVCVLLVIISRTPSKSSSPAQRRTK